MAQIMMKAACKTIDGFLYNGRYDDQLLTWVPLIGLVFIQMLTLLLQMSLRRGWWLCWRISIVVYILKKNYVVPSSISVPFQFSRCFDYSRLFLIYVIGIFFNPPYCVRFHMAGPPSLSWDINIDCFWDCMHVVRARDADNMEGHSAIAELGICLH